MINSNKYHKSEIEELRSHRNKLRAENSFLIKSTEDLLKSFNVDNGVALVSFDSLKELNLNQIYDVNESVSFMLEEKTENKLVFTTYMQENGRFGLQEHDCFEVVEVVKGNLFETERGYKVYTQGEIVTYSPFEKHKPYSTSNSVYKVIFYKKLP